MRPNQSMREPFGHTAIKKPHECAVCKRTLGEGYSCPQCEDLRGLYVLATPKQEAP